jgi:exopolysaccharide production protein ExoZ
VQADSQDRNKNLNIQALRAVAAYGVVVHHLIFVLNNYVAHYHININVGSKGVDIFFVISGYIMARTTSERSTTPWEFAKSRIIRIVPVYWILTLSAFAIMLIGFKIFGEDPVYDNVIRSLFFVPYPDGPVLFVGWTLNYEMMFYLIFSLTLFVRNRGLRLAMAVCEIVLISFLGRLQTTHYTLTYWSSPIILEFALGIVAYLITRQLRSGRSAAALMVVAGFSGLFCNELVAFGVERWLMVETSAFLIVAGAVYLEHSGVGVGKGFLVLQGDASYSLYLTHPFVLQVIGKVAILSGLTSSGAGLAITLCTMFVAAGVFATWFHLGVERPMTSYLKSITAPRANLRYIARSTEG